MTFGFVDRRSIRLSYGPGTLDSRRAGYDRRVAEDAAANSALIDRFYEAFGRRDHETMAACYAPDARFSDPVFQDLRRGRGRSDVADALRARHRPRAQPFRRAGGGRSRLGPLGGRLHLHGDRAARPQRDRGPLSLPRRADRRAQRRVRPLALGAPGARAGRRAVGLVAAGAEQGPRPGAPEPRRVHGRAPRSSRPGRGRTPPPRRAASAAGRRPRPRPPRRGRPGGRRRRGRAAGPRPRSPG